MCVSKHPITVARFTFFQVSGILFQANQFFFMYILVSVRIFFFFFFCFSRQGFSVALGPVLERALVGQICLELTEICLPLPPKCWD